MCVVAVLISYSSWGLISPSAAPGSRVVHVIVSRVKCLRWLEMGKIISNHLVFPTTAELPFWLLSTNSSTCTAVQRPDLHYVVYVYGRVEVKVPPHPVGEALRGPKQS